MKTQIFKSKKEFLQREDKSINGVSESFAESNIGWEENNNIGCWNCYGCHDCYDCYDCSDCYGCYGCHDCYGCSDCSDCSRCSDFYDEEDLNNDIDAPLIKNIHSLVYNTCKVEGSLNMKEWHLNENIKDGKHCGTTHCRAGWVVTLAGKEGVKLEQETSTLFAAMQIYRASSNIKVSPARFFDTNEKALEDMERCSKEEKGL